MPDVLGVEDVDTNRWYDFYVGGAARAVDLDPVASMIRQSVYSVEQFGLPGVEEERASCACCQAQRYCVGGGDATSVVLHPVVISSSSK